MNWLAIKILNYLLLKPCPNSIPRTGEKGKQIDCYSMNIFNGQNPKLLIKSINKFGFRGNHWDGNSFCNEASIPFKLSEGLILNIEHYHGLVTYSYKGLIDYAVHEFTGIYKIQSFYFLYIKQRIPQFFFNKKNLQLPDRMKLLGKIIEKQANDPKQPFSSLALMTYLYSTRWYLHPQKDLIRKKLELYLESFVASEEIINSDKSSDYMITGKAIATLERYQIETKRAKDAKSIQKWLLILTGLLAFFAAVQSGLIKSFILIDLEKLWNLLKSYM